MLPRTRSFALLLLAAVATGCLSGCLAPAVVGNEGGGDAVGIASASGPSSSTSTSSAAGGTPGAAVALFGPIAGLDCWSTSCPEDDALYLLVDSDGVTCIDPVTRVPSGTTGFALTIAVPPALQRVGVYELEEVDGVFVVHGQFLGGSSGAITVGAGGDASQGTLEIVSIDDTSIVFRVSDFTSTVSSDGEYTARRCGVAELPPEGIAVTGALPGGEGGGSTVDHLEELEQDLRIARCP